MQEDVPHRLSTVYTALSALHLLPMLRRAEACNTLSHGILNFTVLY